MCWSNFVWTCLAPRSQAWATELTPSNRVVLRVSRRAPGPSSLWNRKLGKLSPLPVPRLARTVTKSPRNADRVCYGGQLDVRWVHTGIRFCSVLKWSYELWNGVCFVSEELELIAAIPSRSSAFSSSPPHHSQIFTPGDSKHKSSVFVTIMIPVWFSVPR